MENIVNQHITNEIEKAIKVIKDGGVILYPTDTIWALGCDPNNNKAIKKILQIKRRTENKSLIILMCEIDNIQKYIDTPHPIALELYRQWNKPLTIVFPRAKGISKMVVNNDNTLGIRITKEIFTFQLIKTLGHPIVSTSANLSGYPSPVSYKTISTEIKESVDHIVDYRKDSFTEMKPSTIIRINDNGSFEVLRP
ncbi:MAG: threonylcarbamoyl-AMP synthase [Bacteroidales bacterium]|nr:threonylcarbamoyl-AMP synthase [Bacteroidales bacterium]